MKNLQKILAGLTLLSLSTGLLSGCTTTPVQNGQGDAKVYKVGISQYMEHGSLDAAYKGFVDGLAEGGYVDGENLKITYQNAQGDPGNNQTIAQNLVADKNDLILAIATNSAQSLAALTKEIPILVTAVTDPADSKLVATNEAPGGNISGTSDLTPIKEQIELMLKLAPNTKNIALLYTSSEQNSIFQIQTAKEVCDELGIGYIEAAISETSEIQSVLESLLGKIDGIYIPTDNKVASAMASVASVANKAKLPVITGAPAMAEDGGLASVGVDYYGLGKLTAQQAIAILKGEKTPATMPIEYMTPSVYINEATATLLDIKID